MDIDSNPSKKSSTKSNGSSPTLITTSSKGMSSVPSHTPMSERQQLALIKKLEKEEALEAAAATLASASNSSISPSTSAPNSNHKLTTGIGNDTPTKRDRASNLISPPRHPLQVMNAVATRFVDHLSAQSMSSNRIEQLKQSGYGPISNIVNVISSSPARLEPLSSNNSCGSTPVTNNTSYYSSSSSSPYGRSPALERLFKKISKKNGKGETPLHTAAIRGSRRLVRTLLTLGANPNAQDNAEWSPLHEACNRGNLGVVRLLHKHGADINLKGFGRDTPLHDAARNGQIKVVKYLVRSGADLFAKNANGKTPREEVELVTSTKGLQSSGGCGESELDPDYYKALSFLSEIEDLRESKKEIEYDSIHSNDISSDESESVNTEDEDAENEDVIRFLAGSTSSINGNKKSPKDRTNCSNSSASYLEVKKIFQNLGLSPTKFIENSPAKHSKEIDQLTKLKQRNEKNDDSHQKNEWRDVPISKIRLTYGMESEHGNVKDKLVSPSKSSLSKPLKSTSRDLCNVQFNTKEKHIIAKQFQTTADNHNSTTCVKLSGNSKIRISTCSLLKPKQTFSSSNAPTKRMEKSSTSSSGGTSSGPSSQSASVGEKRPLSSNTSGPQDHHIDDNDDETKRKKQKLSSASSASLSSGSSNVACSKDETNTGKDLSSSSNIAPASSTVGTSSAGSATGKSSRNTRGSSSEKILGKSSTGKGRGSMAGSSASDKSDRKSPSSSSGSASATNSPKKPQSRDHSDNENEDSDNSSKVSGKSPGMGNASEAVSAGSGLKVPPLKIVLSTSGTGNNSSSNSGSTIDGTNTNVSRNGNNGNGTSSANIPINTLTVNTVASSSLTSSTAVSDQDQNKKHDGTNTNPKSVSDIDSVESGMTGGENAERTGSSSGASTPGDKEGEKIGSKRVTRSKGQGGSESGNSSCDTNASGPTTSQTGGEQVARSSASTISGSSTIVSHSTPGSSQVIEGANIGRVGTSVSTSTTGSNSARDPLVSSSSTPVTMNISNATTAMPSNSLATSVGDNVQPSKASSINTVAAGTSSAGLNSGTIGIATTSASASSVAAGSSATSSSYTDYRQIKRKLRSQIEENNSPTVGQHGQGSSSKGSYSMASGSGGHNGGNGSTSNGRASSIPSSSVAAPSTMVSTSTGMISSTGSSATEPMNDIEKYLNIRKQVEQRRKNLFPVQPKPPQGFKDYLMNRKTYLLQENARERLRMIQKILPPPSLGEGPLRELFKEQEQERYELRMKHVVEKEKLVLAVEQEILRVHGRAARALANQSLPFSVCTILRDEEIYTPIDPEQEEKNRDIRSRYNGRLFLSWLQDVDDKWEKIKEQMVLRHHNEAESLNAVQKMDWEWKVNELQAKTVSGGQKNSGKHDPSYQIDDLHIPMVHVSDDFDLANC